MLAGAAVFTDKLSGSFATPARLRTWRDTAMSRTSHEAGSRSKSDAVPPL